MKNVIEEYPFHGYLEKYEDGRIDVKMLDGELWGIDFPKSQDTPNHPPNYRSLEETLSELYGEKPENFHGLLIVFANLKENDGKLPLSVPLGGGAVVLDNDYLDELSAYDFFKSVSTDPKYHDGAVIVDSKTGRVYGYHVRLCDIPVNGFEEIENGDGTRKGIAKNYSRYAWVDSIYTVSENGGGIWKYKVGVSEEIKDEV